MNSLQLSGLEKASVLVLSLGLKQSAKVFEHLTEQEREILSAQIIKIKHVDAATKQRVLDEVSEIVGMKPTVQLVEPVPIVTVPKRGREINIQDMNVPLKWIEAMEPVDAAAMLSSERSHSIALVISRLSPQYAADIITNLDDKLRNDVVHKLTFVRSVSDEVIEAIDETLRRKAEKQSGAASKDRYTPSTLLESLGRVGGSAASAPKVLSSVDDIVLLTDLQIRTLVGQVKQSDLCQVLKVAGEDLRAAVMRNMPDDVATAVEQEMSSAAQVTLRELESAQRRIVDAMKRCVDDGIGAVNATSC